MIVIVLLAQLAVTPEGKFVGDPIPVAPAVVIVMLGFIEELIQTFGLLDGAPAVFEVITVIVPEAFTLPHPPVKGIL